MMADGQTEAESPIVDVEIVDDVPADLDEPSRGRSRTPVPGRGMMPTPAHTLRQPSTGEQAFEAHLGGVHNVMLIAWNPDDKQFDSMALRVLERTRNGRLVFELPDPEWALLLERDYDTVCLTAQVDEKFVTVEGTIERVEHGPIVRLAIEPTSHTFWDVASGKVFRVAAESSRKKTRLLSRVDRLFLEGPPPADTSTK